jgi:type III secretory pathway component EscR
MKFIVLLLSLFIAACTNQEIYESIQNNKRNECSKEPGLTAQKKCEEALMPYNEYEEKRKEN